MGNSPPPMAVYTVLFTPSRTSQSSHGIVLTISSPPAQPQAFSFAACPLRKQKRFERTSPTHRGAAPTRLISDPCWPPHNCSTARRTIFAYPVRRHTALCLRVGVDKLAPVSPRVVFMNRVL